MVTSQRWVGGMGHVNVHPWSPEPASGSGIMSHFGTSSWVGMLISTCFAWSQGCQLSAVPLSTPGSPRSLASVASNGPRPYVAQPALYTKSNRPRAWATGPPTMHRHTPPMQGTQDDEHHSRLAGPGIRHTSLLNPILSVCAAVGGDTEYLIGQHELVICPPGVLNLRIDVK